MRFPVSTTDLLDNSNGDNAQILVPQNAHQKVLLERYAGLRLADFAKLGVQVYSRDYPYTGFDEAGESSVVYSFHDTGSHTIVETGNCMGVLRFRDNLSYESLILQIKSRFDSAGKGQYFLLYMLGKVFGGSVFKDMDLPSNSESSWDLLIALIFRRKLLEANSVGPYRSYVVNHHNDLHYRGTFDLDAHLRHNMPCIGKLAYTTHDYCFDNPLNHLMRHALVKISRTWPWLLDDGPELIALRHLYEQNTPNWRDRDVWDCVRTPANLVPVRHPLYAPYYEPLRVLARSLLHEEGANPYDATGNDVEGFLFDGAWLWEEYLNTVLARSGFDHARNKMAEGPHRLFTDGSRAMYPDFWKGAMVVDTKYKRFQAETPMEDLRQIITYMHVLPAKTGMFIYPLQQNQDPNDGIQKELIGTLNGLGGSVYKLGFPVPSYQNNFREFAVRMEELENALLLLMGKA